MRGGARPGAGRPQGGKNKSTLERQAVEKAFNQRVMEKADALFNAQFALAVGSMKVFRVDEERENGKVKRNHVHVTDPDEIKALLDEHDGKAGEVNGRYYCFSDAAGNNPAIEALLNRALGKPTERIEMSDPAHDTSSATKTFLNRRISSLAIKTQRPEREVELELQTALADRDDEDYSPELDSRIHPESWPSGSLLDGTEQIIEVADEQYAS